MATNRFDSLMKRTAREIASSQKESQDWFKDSVSDLGKEQKERRDPNKIFKRTTSPVIGSMYLFFYDPKYKQTLPFYDMHPLVFPIEMYQDGFLGLNLHYLKPIYRLRLLGDLDTTKNNNKYNESTRLNISYRILKSYSSQFLGHEGCIKRYLLGHVRSSFHTIYPSDWEKVALLPLQRWAVNNKYGGRAPY